MGMFDTVLVAESLITEAIKDVDIDLQSSEGYFDFQTKDLDNSLALFYIQSDGSFIDKRQKYKHVEPDPDSKREWNFGSMEPDGPPEMVVDTRTAYINFYDFYTSDKERIFITFTAHVKNGKLQEPILIKEIERSNLEDEAIKNKKNQELWNQVRATWEWKAAHFLSEAKWKIKKFFYPLTSRIDKLEQKLRSTARKKYFDENNINYW
jgi:hypothetical protein